MNATLSEGGALSVFLRPSVDINQAFLTVVLTFSTDDRNFDIHYLNKTVDFCQLSSKPRYEPFIKLGYKIVSEKVHLPQHCPIKKVCRFFERVSIYLMLYFQNDSFLTTNYTFVTDQLPPVFPATKILFYTAYSLLKNGTLHKIFDLKVTGHVRHRN